MVDIESLYQTISEEEIDKKISHFKALDFKNMSYDEIREEIFRVISIKNQSSLDIWVIQSEKNISLYRVRKRNIDTANISIQDLWEPPAEKAKMNRLNKSWEPLLYVSIYPWTASDELWIGSGEEFTLIEYQVSEPLQLIRIWLEKDNNFSVETKRKISTINTFIRKLFSRKVSAGDEHLYQITESIITDYSSISPEFFNWWIYESIKIPWEYNIALKPEDAHKKLKVISVNRCIQH